MEADWEVEIGSGAPIIDAHWSGFLNLQEHPDLAARLPEAAQLPALADALIQLNAPLSPVLTTKCDLWCVDPSENALDPIEIGAPPDASQAEYAVAQACYIDILSRPPLQWSQIKEVENLCKAICAGLRAVSLRSTRADFIVRRAILDDEQECLGITAYLVACAASDTAALRLLAQALAALSGSILAA